MEKKQSTKEILGSLTKLTVKDADKVSGGLRTEQRVKARKGGSEQHHK